MSGRWWWRRGALALGAYAGLLLGGSVAELDPAPVPLLMVVLLMVFLGGTLLDGFPAATPVGARDRAGSWHLDDVRSGEPRGRDSRTAANLRALESHTSAKVLDGHLRDRLAALADQQLQLSHGVGLDDPEAAVLLGREVTGVVRGPVRRLRRAEIEACVRRIEELDTP